MFRHALLVAGMAAAIAIAATAQRYGASPPRTYSLEETERLVKADVATMVRGTVADVTVAERAERRFAGADMCSDSPAANDPAAVDGYAFTLKHAQGHFEYRTDRQGNLKRCVIVRPINP